ncbi:hypothetical protein A2Y26_05515 [candidate division CPR2 bacterium GWD2_39_7]|nr:MAG: hypothetical protein UT60_C0036G0003 [candidate division CPR2 bacterium GW2011_GWD2_39_7]OGB71890.1 MAG: hypothetical protein A2Y26_05515 [candidate division CPR2 bacterium GWD2_39_7]
MGIYKIKTKLKIIWIKFKIGLWPVILAFLKSYKHELTFSAILLASIFIRFIDLNSVPPGLYNDEAVLILQSIDRFKIGPDMLFRAGVLGFSHLFGGNHLMALRFFSAILGVLTVFLIYLLGRLWFNQRIALVASFLAAFSFWPILVSRSIVHANIIPVLFLLMMIFGSLAFREKRKSYFAVLGVLVGLGFYSSLVFWLIPVLFLPIFIYAFYKKPKILKKYEKEISVFESLVMSFMLPGVIYLIWHPEIAFSFWPGPINLAKNVFKSLLLFNIETPAIWHTNLKDEPLLDPFVGISFLSGFIIALKYFHSTKYQFLILGFFASLMPAAFSHNYLYVFKAVGAIPFVFIFSGLAIDWTLASWAKIFPFNKLAKALAAIVFAGLMTTTAIFNIEKYFWAWRGSPEVYQVFNEDLVAATQFLNGLPNESSKYYWQNDRSNIIKALETKEMKEVSLNSLPELKLSSNKNTFVFSEADKPYLAKIQEKFPGGDVGWYVSPYSKRVLFNIYTVNGS